LLDTIGGLPSFALLANAARAELASRQKAVPQSDKPLSPTPRTSHSDKPLSPTDEPQPLDEALDMLTRTTGEIVCGELHDKLPDTHPSKRSHRERVKGGDA
jgi:hypothetical protein